ncbi:MAG TPA: hypothetical protein VL092_03130 [Chitinophagaceae bacterium]|nr:hypothetical protein [Chitinophagaceae bacterium]
MKKTAGFLVCLLLLAAQGKAQEKLYLKNQKEPIACKIIEINTNEIKYQPEDAEQLTIGINKLDAEKIVFKSGRVQYFTDPLDDFNFYKGQKRWIAKVGILSPAFGYTDLYLEKSLKPGKSVEFQANIIGLGKNMFYYNNYTNTDLYLNQRGVSVGAGIKVLRMPDFEVSNRKLLHILQGSYLKPNIMVGYYQRDFIVLDPVTSVYKTMKKDIIISQLAVNFGKQWILDNTFSLEVYGSLGLGVDNFRSQQNKIKKDNMPVSPYLEDENMPYRNFGYTKFGRGDAGLAIGGGVKLGYLFNWKKPKDVPAGSVKARK